jgi:hypothetical protein
MDDPASLLFFFAAENVPAEPVSAAMSIFNILLVLLLFSLTVSSSRQSLPLSLYENPV